VLRVRVRERQLAVLDFDSECRPLSYLGMDRTSAEITGFACSWVGERVVRYILLISLDHYEDDMGAVYTADQAFLWMRTWLASADIVTGHYCRKHDLPMLNGALMERGLPILPELLVQDTHGELPRRKDFSASQESLAGMYGLPESKHHMSTPEWRKANRLTPEGIALTRKRVVSDVRQHKALRKRLIEAGALRAPRRWRP
jgi:hypothetical protein